MRVVVSIRLFVPICTRFKIADIYATYNRVIDQLNLNHVHHGIIRHIDGEVCSLYLRCRIAAQVKTFKPLLRGASTAW